MVVEFADAGFAFEVGEEAFFVVVAQGGDGEMEHFGYLADAHSTAGYSGQQHHECAGGSF